MEKFEDHGSLDDLVDKLRQYRDSIDHLKIPLASWFRTRTETREVILTNIGAIVIFKDGTWSAIHYSDAQELLNHGILVSQKIPIQLVSDNDFLVE